MKLRFFGLAWPLLCSNSMIALVLSCLSIATLNRSMLRTSAHSIHSFHSFIARTIVLARSLCSLCCIVTLSCASLHYIVSLSCASLCIDRITMFVALTVVILLFVCPSIVCTLLFAMLTISCCTLIIVSFAMLTTVYHSLHSWWIRARIRNLVYACDGPKGPGLM
jgi:hypothetical protein